MIRWLRRKWAKAMIPHDLMEIADTTDGHCAVCDNADRLVLVRGWWGICRSCYIDYRAGLINGCAK